MISNKEKTLARIALEVGLVSKSDLQRIVAAVKTDGRQLIQAFKDEHLLDDRSAALLRELARARMEASMRPPDPVTEDGEAPSNLVTLAALIAAGILLVVSGYYFTLAQKRLEDQRQITVELDKVTKDRNAKELDRALMLRRLQDRDITLRQIAEGQWESAKRSLITLSNSGPEARQFRNLYAIALWQTGELDAAVEAFTKLLTTEDSAHAREIAFNLAGVLTARNRPEQDGHRSDAAEAQEILQQIFARLEPGEVPFRFPNEWLFISDWSEFGRRVAGGAAHVPETSGPDPARAAELTAEIDTITAQMTAIAAQIAEASDPAKMIDLARSMRDLRARRVELIRELAPLAEGDGAPLFKVLVSDLESLCDSTGDPRWTDWALALTRLYIAMERYGDGLTLVNRVIATEAGRINASAYWLRVQILMRSPATAAQAQDDIDRAMVLSAAIGASPDESAQQAALVRAIIDVADGLALDAERALTGIIDTVAADSPMLLRARWYRAVARLQMRRVDGARDDLRAIVTATPERSAAWVLLARLELRGGNGADAARAVIAEAWSALQIKELSVEARAGIAPELVSLSALAASVAGEVDGAARLAEIASLARIDSIRSADRDMLRVDLAACAARAQKPDAMWELLDALSQKPLRLAERDYPEFAAYVEDPRFPRIYRMPRPDDVPPTDGVERDPLPPFGG